MRFLADHDVYFKTVRLLRDLGHDVVTAAEADLAQTEDARLMSAAREDHRILVTRDRDFGNLVFVQGLECGVVYLRMLPSLERVVHDELRRVLTQYEESELNGAFVAIEPGRHRIRRLR